MLCCWVRDCSPKIQHFHRFLSHSVSDKVPLKLPYQIACIHTRSIHPWVHSFPPSAFSSIPSISVSLVVVVVVYNSRPRPHQHFTCYDYDIITSCMGGARTSPVHTYRNTVNFLIRGSCWETKAVDGSAFCVCVCVSETECAWFVPRGVCGGLYAGNWLKEKGTLVYNVSASNLR